MSTLKQVLDGLNAWTQQPASSAHLLAGQVEEVLSSIRLAAQALAKEFDSQIVAPDYAALLEGSANAYADLEETLEEILTALQHGHADQVREEALYLKAGMATLRQYTDAIEQWLISPVMRCPRCGTSEADGTDDALCPTCDLELLYPDLQPDNQASRQFLTLGSEFARVFRTYVSVLAGEMPLAELEAPLTQLRSWLQQNGKISTVSRHRDVQPLLETVRSHCQQALEGADLMATAFQSRETADLNRGWGLIFSAAVGLQRCLPEALEALGISRDSSSEGADSIQFSNEE